MFRHTLSRMVGQCGFPLSSEHDSEAQKEDKDDDYFFGDFTWKAVMIEYRCGVVPAFLTDYSCCWQENQKGLLESLLGNWASRSGGWRLECDK